MHVKYNLIVKHISGFNIKYLTEKFTFIKNPGIDDVFLNRA